MPPNSAPPLVGTDRVLAVLAELARHADGASLEEMTRAVASPKPTVHRALASLCRFGFATRNGRPHGVAVDRDGFVFVTLTGLPDNKVAMFDSKTELFAEFQMILKAHEVVTR